MINETYVSFETAKLLKEKGFDELCYQKYDSDGELSFNDVGYINSEKPCDDFYALAPTLQMAIDWFRIEKGIAITPIVAYIVDDEKFVWKIEIDVAKTHDTYDQLWRYEKYEGAVEAGLKYCLRNLI